MSATDQTASSSSGLSLAVRLRDGSADAWRELVDLYGPLIESWCRRAGLPASARPDVGQEVFLAVHRGIAGFDPTRPQATFRGWLWTITRNAVLEWLRRRTPEPPGGSSALGRLAEIPDPWGNASSDDPPSTPDETASLLRRALDEIRPTVAPQTWNAFWNTAVLGRSAPDVADELGLTPAAVRQAKSRLLRRLRRQLGDR
ncbi:MAG TPA: sigma-70 family RNA polymerase sigma factor [Planctomycetaceae bacterium]|nr:sigma-70 family RNA polymerase sigma factor [Planctomycetaceae bacterium]